MDILSTKKIIHCATQGIFKGIKNAISISVAVSVDSLIRNEKIISEEHKTKNCLNNFASTMSYKPTELGRQK